MSSKLFFLQTFGKLKPVEKIEARHQLLLNDYEEFSRVEKSEELKEFLKLEQWVNSGGFRQKKSEIEAIRFKGSAEYNQLNEFQKLAKSKPVRGYFEAEKSEALKKFGSLKESKKVAEFYSLKDYTENGEFQREKSEVLKQVYKGSAEEKHLLEFKKLQDSKPVKAYFELAGSQELKAHSTFLSSEKFKRFLALKNAPNNGNNEKKELKLLLRDAEIRKYFRFEKSAKLKFYHEINGSHTLTRYNELLKLTGTDEFKKRKAFLEDKSKFEKSEAFIKYQRFKQLSNDGDIKFYLSYEKSKTYKNYLDVKDSFDLNRYFELKKITGSEGFAARKKYLEDKNKWEKSEEFAQQKKYLEMKKLPHIGRYFKYKPSNIFDFFKTWELVFEDRFETAKIDDSKWSAVGFWAKKTIGENYSLPGDLQHYSSGANISTGKKGLALQVRKEKAKGKLWNTAAGFLPADFQYTSGQLNTGGSFRLEDGIVEAKIKYTPKKGVVSSFFLVGGKSSPQVNVLEMGVKNRLGLLSSENGKINFSGESLSQLKTGKYYIFGVEKSGSKITWKINGQPLFEAAINQSDFPMFLNFASIVVNEIPATELPADFEVAWVRSYRKK